MPNVIYTATLDFTDNGVFNAGWRIKQGDFGSSSLNITLSDNGVIVFDDSIEPEIVFKRADGRSIVSTMQNAGPNSGYYSYNFVGNELAVPGPCVVDVKIFGSDSRSSTASCRFEVIEDTIGYDPEGAHTYVNSDLVENLREYAESALTASQQAQTSATTAGTAAGEASTSATNAATSATASSNSKLDAEAWAVGTRNGQAVPSTDPAYNNNSKYWSLQIGSLNSVVSEIVAEKSFSLNDYDIHGYVASDTHSSYSEGTIVTVGAGSYRTRIVKVRKGEWIKASLGKTTNIHCLSYFRENGTFIEKIVKGGCTNFKYQFDRDGYVAICTNSSLSDANSVTMYGYQEKDYSDNPEIGWQWGRTTTSGTTIDQNTGGYEFDNVYQISDPIWINPGDKIVVQNYIGSTVACFSNCDQTGYWRRYDTGQGADTKTTYTRTFDNGGFVRITTRISKFNDTTITITRRKTAVDTESHDESNSYTSVNQFLKPGSYRLDKTKISDIPGDEGSLLIVKYLNGSHVAQIVYNYISSNFFIRLMGYNGTPYSAWHNLIDPFKNAIYSNYGSNVYKNDYSGATSLSEFTDAPFMGGIAANPPTILDRPNNKNGVMQVFPHNSSFVEQMYYSYATGTLLVRLLGVNGTPYNDWKAIGEPLFGKSIIGIGDSLMRGNSLDVSQTWLGLIGSKCGANVYNYGLNGNTVARQTVETTNPAMVDRIASIHDQVANTDYFVLLGGANDRRLNVPLGADDSNDVTTFCGALNKIIDDVRKYWPKSHIVFMTNYDRFPQLNSLGLSDIDYVEAMQRVCAKKHIYCYDNYHNSGVNFHDANFSAWADEGIYNGQSANKHFSPDAYIWLMPKYKALLEMN